MNKVIILGRLTRDPEVRYTQGENSIAIARYTIAVDRPRKDSEGNSQADFISCVALGRNGEFAEKYLRKGTKIAIEGRIQTGSYEKDGHKVYTTDVLVEHHEFVENKGNNGERDAYYDNMAAGSGLNIAPTGPVDENGFMNIPDGIDEALPFN